MILIYISFFFKYSWRKIVIFMNITKFEGRIITFKIKYNTIFTKFKNVARKFLKFKICKIKCSDFSWKFSRFSETFLIMTRILKKKSSHCVVLVYFLLQKIGYCGVFFTSKKILKSFDQGVLNFSSYLEVSYRFQLLLCLLPAHPSEQWFLQIFRLWQIEVGQLHFSHFWKIVQKFICIIISV
jgi:hypothetical protein